MTYHILHITTNNCKLSAEKGLLFCKFQEGETKTIAISDIRAVIVAAFGVSFTNNCISRLLENNVVILHCNNSYQPAGWSVPAERIVRTKVFFGQIARNENFERELWKKIIKRKVENQAQNLDMMGILDHKLYQLINKPLISEANIAKRYWEYYFSYLGTKNKMEHKNAGTFENICLNYGYGVICSLIYRAVLIHGLVAGLGICHKEKYKSNPLVYDLMEPYRAFIDYYLYRFQKEFSEDFKKQNIKAWFKYVSSCLADYKLKIGKAGYKIADTFDIYVEKISNAFIGYDVGQVFLPELKNQYFFKGESPNEEQV